MSNRKTKVEPTTEPAIVGNTVLAAVYSEQERIMIRNGWCVAYNTWWKCSKIIFGRPNKLYCTKKNLEKSDKFEKITDSE